MTIETVTEMHQFAFKIPFLSGNQSTVRFVRRLDDRCLHEVDCSARIFCDGRQMSIPCTGAQQFGFFSTYRLQLRVDDCPGTLHGADDDVHVPGEEGGGVQLQLDGGAIVLAGHSGRGRKGQKGAERQ